MNTRKFSTEQEKYVANLLNGSVQPSSGSTPFAKGDVITDDWLIECKTTTKPKSSFSIKKEWIDNNFIEERRCRNDRQESGNVKTIFCHRISI